MRPILAIVVGACLFAVTALGAEGDSARERLEASARAIDAKAVAWRHDFNRNPELSNQEERTAGIVAAHLRSCEACRREAEVVAALNERLVDARLFGIEAGWPEKDVVIDALQKTGRKCIEIDDVIVATFGEYKL